MTNQLIKGQTFDMSEEMKWALMSDHADAAWQYSMNWIDLRNDGGNHLGHEEVGRFKCIIRAVSWVESKHGTAGPNEPRRDPMQCGNPNDSWWRTLTGQLGNGDRFVRGPNFTGAEGAYWAAELAGVFDADAPAQAKVSSLGNTSQQQQGHSNASFNSQLSYLWGVAYLIHRINTQPSLGDGRRTYQCGDSTKNRLFLGAITYNGGGDPQYGDRLRDALIEIGCGDDWVA